MSPKGTLIPKLPRTKSDINLMIAILGTTISPYLFFWQAGQEIEEQKAEGKTTVAERQGATRTEIADRKLDVNLGMLASNLVMYFIILTTAATLHAKRQDGHQLGGGCGVGPPAAARLRRRNTSSPSASSARACSPSRC